MVADKLAIGIRSDGAAAAFDIFGNFTSGNTSAQLHKSVSRRKELVEYALSSGNDRAVSIRINGYWKNVGKYLRTALASSGVSK